MVFLKRKEFTKRVAKKQPFSSAKVQCTYDHAKPTRRDVNPENIILHIGTNDLNFDKTSSQIARSIIDLDVSLKANTNTITIFFITPQNDHLNNKASKVNDLLVNMCGERHIPNTGHSKTIRRGTHLNKSELHVNKFGTIAFAKNIPGYLLEVNLLIKVEMEF